MLRRQFLPLLAAALITQSAYAEDGSIAEAKVLFGKYVTLEHAYDGAVADLYSDNAVITNKRTYPTGQVRELTLPVDKYKELVRSAMPIAATRGDRSVYSEVTYTLEGQRVRIKATRFSELKKYASPISLLVGPSESGNWLIYEELSESQP